MKVVTKRTGWDPFLAFPATAAVLLGLIGFVPGLGFWGPFAQGSTGQVGVLLGCGTGLAAAMRGLSTRWFLLALVVIGAIWAAVLFVWGQSLDPGESVTYVSNMAERSGIQVTNQSRSTR
jgi:hypothetical protein